MKTWSRGVGGLIALALLGAAITASCVAPRRTKGGHPTNVFGGKKDVLAPETDGIVQDPERATCTPAEEGRCICVAGAFESGDETWDFACCFDGDVWLYFCGDTSPGCDPETLACISATVD